MTRSAAHTSMHSKNYVRLLVMGVLSFISMYVLMYAMVNAFADVFMNLNQVYMAGLMAAPMVIIELFVMRPMYENRRINVLTIAGCVLALAVFFIFIRQQTAVSDVQFLRSMIPHHSGAILMCGRASIRDSELRELCRTIISGQQSEIDQMKAKLDALER